MTSSKATAASTIPIAGKIQSPGQQSGRVRARHSTDKGNAANLAIPSGATQISKLFAFLSRPCTARSREAFAGPGNDDQAWQVFENFWDSTREERIEFCKKLIDQAGGIQSFLFANHAFIKNTLVKQFLPIDTPERQAMEAKNPGSTAFVNGNKFAEFVCQNLMRQNKPEMLANLLSAIVAANHDFPQVYVNQKNENERIWGHRLCRFLMESGLIKIAQNIHSFEPTPKLWLEGLAPSKYDAEAMGDQNFLREMRDAVPDEVRKHLTLGKHVGAGTYMDSYRIKIAPEYLKQNPLYRDEPEGQSYVLQLVKPDSGQRSIDGFDLVIDALETLSTQDADAKKSFAGIIELFQQTRNLMEEETDMSMVKEKATMASKLYDDAVIRTPEADIEFYTAGVFDHGQKYRICREIKGQHFNKLPIHTALQKLIKRISAKACSIIEWFNRLRGGAFDYDRHGNQQGITWSQDEKTGRLKIRIGIFDEHGIIMQNASDEQLKLFANILLDSLANSAIHGFNPGSSLKHTFAKAQAAATHTNADDMSYVNNLINSVLRTADYRKSFGLGANALAKVTDQLNVLRTVIKTGAIHPEVAAVFKQRIPAIKALIREQHFPTFSKVTTQNRRARWDAERTRRDDFYPVPTAADAKYTNLPKKIMGQALMFVAPWLLKRQTKEARATELILPEGYAERFKERIGVGEAAPMSA